MSTQSTIASSAGVTTVVDAAPAPHVLQVIASSHRHHQRDQDQVQLATAMRSLVLDQRHPIALELAGTDQQRSLLIRARNADDLHHVKTQLQARLPQANFVPIAGRDDPFHLSPHETVSVVEMHPGQASYLPLQEFDHRNKGEDPILGILGALDALPSDLRAIAQIALVPASPNWSRPYQRKALEHALEPERQQDRRTQMTTRDDVGAPSTMLLVMGGLFLAGYFLLHYDPKLMPVWMPGTFQLLLHGQWQQVFSGSHHLEIEGIIGGLVLLPALLLLLRRGWSRLFQTPMYDMRSVAEKTSRSAYHVRLRLYVIGPTRATAPQPSFWLLKHPYQRLRDLEFAFQIPASTIRRHLQLLKQQALVETVMATIVSPVRPDALYYLNTRGIERVAELVGGADPAKLARMWKANEAALLQLLPRLGSYLPLQDVVLSFIADAPRHLASPGGYPAAIRWHWQQDYMHSFERKKKRMTCWADGVVVFRRRPLTMTPQEETAESWYCVLWMFDPGFSGSNDLPMMRERLEQMLHWRESSERWSFYKTFPPVLVIAPTQHQRDLWVQSAQDAAAHLRLAPLKGASTILVEGSPWRYSWYHLDGSGVVALESLIAPLVPQAIPSGLLAPRQIEPGTVRRRAENGSKVIIGNFQARAKHLEASEADLKSKTQISLFSLSLPHRYLELLQHIYAVPLIAPHELAMLLQRETDTLQRYLSDLQRLHCLEMLATECEKRLVLTETGLRLIAALLGVSLTHIAKCDAITHHWQQRGVEHALRTIEHTAGIYTFLAKIQQQAKKIGHELCWWETTRSFRRYRFQGAWHNLMPDALFGYQTKETGIEAWLEWDRGSMHLKPMTEKFEAYAHYIRSQQYRQDHRTAPILLLVAPQNGREQSLRTVLASVFGALPLTVWTTTEPLLQAQGPLGLIWRSGISTEKNGFRSAWIEQQR